MFGELTRSHSDIDDLGRFFGRPETSLGNWVPRMETYRKDNHYVLRFDLPGVDPKDVQIRSEGNVLSVSGERKSEEKAEGYQQTSYGKFERAVTLPPAVEADKITAHSDHGVLEIRVPLPAQLAERKIPIQGSEKETKQIDSKAA